MYAKLLHVQFWAFGFCDCEQSNLKVISINFDNDNITLMNIMYGIFFRYGC